MLPQRYVFSSKSQLISPTLRSANCCYCYHKGTYFQANHNSKPILLNLLLVVIATTKVRIFKQITTEDPHKRSATSCYCYHKGTYFQANHNAAGVPLKAVNVVIATTKVRIFKQITTRTIRPGLIHSCYCYHKGTYFQANHNTNGVRLVIMLLLLLPQRYVFSSKSQPV